MNDNYPMALRLLRNVTKETILEWVLECASGRQLLGELEDRLGGAQNDLSVPIPKKQFDVPFYIIWNHRDMDKALTVMLAESMVYDFVEWSTDVRGNPVARLFNKGARIATFIIRQFAMVQQVSIALASFCPSKTTREMDQRNLKTILSSRAVN